MGRVFTFEEIKQGWIPATMDFKEMRTILEAGLAANAAIIGAVICGSCVRGDYNTRSDLDCVVLYRQEDRNKAVNLFQGLEMEAAGRYVPLELIPLDDKLAGTPDHHLSPIFLEHLRLSARLGGVIKENPLELISPNPLSFREDTRLYLVNKVRKLEKGSANLPVLSTEKQCLFLQKALELPVYVARKIVQCKGHDLTGGDSKGEVLKAYVKTRFTPAIELLEELVSLDRRYSEALDQQIMEAPDQASYGKILREIEEAVPKVLQFARLNLADLRTQ